MAGRPSDITTIVGHRDDGSGITVADRVLDSIRLHGYIETGAAAAGVTKETVHAWRRTAGKVLIRLKGNPPIEGQNVTKDEAACLRFSDSVDRVKAEWVSEMLAIADGMATGGGTITEEHVEYGPTSTDTDGTPGEAPVVKRRTVTKTLAPDGAMLRWRVSHADPKHFGEKIELSGPDGSNLLSLDERAVAILDTLRANQAAKKPKRKRPAPKS